MDTDQLTLSPYTDAIDERWTRCGLLRAILPRSVQTLSRSGQAKVLLVDRDGRGGHDSRAHVGVPRRWRGIEHRGFGSFSLRYRRARMMARNPRTGALLIGFRSQTSAGGRPIGLSRR